MRNEDKVRFVNVFNAACVTYNRETSELHIKIFFDVLSEFDIASVEKAFYKHLQTSKFFPVPADICNLIPNANSKHVGADEAWAIAIKAYDQSETVIVTDEIMEAAGVAESLYETDKVAARMAFKDAYTRIVASASDPVWRIDTGTSKTLRIAAVKAAIDSGRIDNSGNKFSHLLESPEIDLGNLLKIGVEKGKISHEDGMKHIGFLKSMFETDEKPELTDRELMEIDIQDAENRKESERIENERMIKNAKR